MYNAPFIPLIYMVPLAFYFAISTKRRKACLKEEIKTYAFLIKFIRRSSFEPLGSSDFLRLILSRIEYC